LSDAEQKEKENRREGEDLGYSCIVIPGNGALQKKKGVSVNRVAGVQSLGIHGIATATALMPWRSSVL
jgi:hypothetical protein